VESRSVRPKTILKAGTRIFRATLTGPTDMPVRGSKNAVHFARAFLRVSGLYGQ